jgi:hypothetical protein
MIAFKCSGCGRGLKVADELAGRRFHCPRCKLVNGAPAAPSGVVSPKPPLTAGARTGGYWPEGSLVPENLDEYFGPSSEAGTPSDLTSEDGPPLAGAARPRRNSRDEAPTRPLGLYVAIAVLGGLIVFSLSLLAFTEAVAVPMFLLL